MPFSRLQALIGADKMEKLKQSTVIVFGLGGVGSFAAEALARSAIGKMVLVDYDRIDRSNLNRQLEALHSTIGQLKTEVMAKRLLDINPELTIEVFSIRLTAENVDEFVGMRADFVLDCIDDVNAKTLLIQRCQTAGVNIVSSMGFANKLQVESIKFTTLDKTSVCPLARTIRQQLRQSGASLKVPVVYSTEIPRASNDPSVKLGSSAFVPPAAGLMLASYVIRKLIDQGE
ncbi:MAG: tRNA threonylcarbamoyladenosine dehydratase [Bacilli bacterium]|nr:tRNA threonylcarbamoyladenosine dehydratase [Bacilli bacterium]MBN2696173.1 tRNA threonylcarbamoyladenosine dehydratase [Bacilli bacterium]